MITNMERLKDITVTFLLYILLYFINFLHFENQIYCGHFDIIVITIYGKRNEVASINVKEMYAYA